MSIQNYSEDEDKINITGYYDHSSRKIYFSFTHITSYTTNTYTLYVNEVEVDVTKYMYLKLDDSSVHTVEENVEYYLKKDDFLINNIKIDIIVINRDIQLQGFGDHNGVYTYIYDGYYKNSSGAYIHLVYHNGVPHWELVDDTVKHITITSFHSNHPYGHSFEPITHEPLISSINISGGSLNIEYKSDYEKFIE
jgi:hypothetical protein